MLVLDQGKAYSRADVKELAGLDRGAKGGPWDTGVVQHENEFVIFANVGVTGRTGHYYNNRWEGDLFHWYHKKNSRLRWNSVQKLLANERVVHLFWRDRQKAPFNYAGQANCVESFDTSPVEIVWSFVHESADLEFYQGPDEILPGEYPEGGASQVTVNRYERSSAARQACIAHYGVTCSVCDFSFEERYGELGAGFIHVHHLVPISEIGANYTVDPIQDLRPICPNCHAMIHKQRPPFSIEDMREMIRG